MNWSYIAGFMDGEGSVMFQSSSASFSVTVALSQSGSPGKILLEEIRSFIRGYGIRSAIQSKKPKKGELAKKIMHSLRLGQRESVCKFLTNVIPYLHMKKTPAQDALRTFKLFPLMKPDGGWRTRRENLAIFKRESGEVSN